MMPSIQLISSEQTPNLKQTKCASCALKKLCLTAGLDDREVVRLDQIVGRRRRILRGETLYHMGDRFRNLYAIRFGHFKTYQINPSGEQQITGFQMAGELLGMDAIDGERHHSYAVALEDSEVCEIPFARLGELFGQMPTLLRHFHRIMSQEITREQSAMLSLGNMRADRRVAIFLLNLSARYAARGYSSTSFQLRMSREDIGNYLGLTIESISRIISRFKKIGWLSVETRDIQFHHRKSLEALASGVDLGESKIEFRPSPTRQIGGAAARASVAMALAA